MRFACGAIAQLGERLAGSQKVAGSSPAGSTRNPPKEAGFALVEDITDLDQSPGGSKRYPIPASVWNDRGCDGSGSSLRRIWAM